MKLLVLSDAHANLDALLAIESVEPDVDLTVFAGDFVDWGFYPREVLAWFARRPHLAVRGNHDDAILEAYARPERQPIGQEESYLALNVNLLTEADCRHLAAYPKELTFEADGIVYYMRHLYGDVFQEPERALREGRGVRLFESIWGNALPHREKPKERRIILGHSHMCHIIDYGNGRMLLNPGSVAYRKGADMVARGGDYLVIENGIPFLRHVDYPTAHLSAKLAATAFAPHIYRDAVLYAASDVD